jgi:hypothetical protein
LDIIGSLLELCDVLNQSWGDDSESDFFGRDGIEFCSVTATTFEHSNDIDGNARKSRVFTGHPSFEIENAGGVRAFFCGLTYQPTNN